MIKELVEECGGVDSSGKDCIECEKNLIGLSFPQGDDQLVHVPLSRSAQERGDIFRIQIIALEGDELIEDGLRIPHRSSSCSRDRFQNLF